MEVSTPKMTNYTRKLFKGASWIFIFTFLAAILSYLLRLVLARNLTLTEFGLFYAVYSFISFFLIFQEAGLGNALVKYLTKFKLEKKYNHIKSAIYYVLGIRVFLAILTAIVFILISGFLSINYFHNPDAKPIIILLSLWFIGISITSTIAKTFQGLQKLARFSSVVFIMDLFIVVFTIVLLKSGFKLMAPVYSFIIAILITFIIFFPWLVSTFNFFKYKFIKSFSIVKKLFSFAIPSAVLSVSAKIISQSDVLILTYFKPLEAVGIYNVILPTAMLFLFFGKSIQQTIFPISGEMSSKKENKKLSRGLNLIQKYLFILITPIILILFSFTKLFLGLVFGANYIPGHIAMKILLLGVTFYLLAIISVGVLMGIGKPMKATKIILCLALINIVLNFILIPSLGIIGAAISTSATYLLGFIFLTSTALKELKYKFPTRIWLKALLACGAFAITIYILKGILVFKPWIEFFIVLSLSTILYGLLLFIMKIVNKQEISYLIKRVRFKGNAFKMVPKN